MLIQETKPGQSLDKSHSDGAHYSQTNSATCIQLLQAQNLGKLRGRKWPKGNCPTRAFFSCFERAIEHTKSTEVSLRIRDDRSINLQGQMYEQPNEAWYQPSKNENPLAWLTQSLLVLTDHTAATFLTGTHDLHSKRQRRTRLVNDWLPLRPADESGAFARESKQQMRIRKRQLGRDDGGNVEVRASQPRLARSPGGGGDCEQHAMSARPQSEEAPAAARAASTAARTACTPSGAASRWAKPIKRPFTLEPPLFLLCSQRRRRHARGKQKRHAQQSQYNHYVPSGWEDGG